MSDLRRFAGDYFVIAAMCDCARYVIGVCIDVDVCGMCDVWGECDGVTCVDVISANMQLYCSIKRSVENISALIHLFGRFS